MQEIKEIHIKDLVLWSENPREPVDKNATAQEILDMAMNEEKPYKWNLESFCESMGGWVDLSESPTVVYKNDKPIVYDGNRRVLIGKIIHGYVTVKDKDALKSKDAFQKLSFPKKVPCNVCDEKTALKNIERKHVKDSSWGTLERDIFQHYHMKKEKSPFLMLDEKAKIISDNSFMNQRFVKFEIFSKENLKQLNIFAKDNYLEYPYNKSELNTILKKIVNLIKNETITTRENRGELIRLLQEDPKIASIISKNKGSAPQPQPPKEKPPRKKRRPRTPKNEIPLFGKDFPETNNNMINNLLADLEEIHNEIGKVGKSSGKKYSEDATMVIAAGLRLLCHVADRENDRKLYLYIEENFGDAKKELTKEYKTFLKTHGVAKDTMTSLLNTGAHGYSDTITKQQTIALSLIVGKILENTLGTDT